MNSFINLLFSYVICLSHQTLSHICVDVDHPQTIQEKYLARQIEFHIIFRALIADTTHRLLPILDAADNNDVMLLSHYRELLVKLAAAKELLEAELSNFYNRFNFDRWKVVNDDFADNNDFTVY